MKKKYKDIEIEVLELDNKYKYHENARILGENEIKCPYIDFESDDVTTYIISKRIQSKKNPDDVIISVNFVYGKKGLEERLEKDDSYWNTFCEHIISRENLSSTVTEKAGALPEFEVSKDTGEVQCMFDKDDLEIIMKGVLKKSHREIVKTPDDLESEEVGNEPDIPKTSGELLKAIIAPQKKEKKKKKSFSQIFSEWEDEQISKYEKKQETKRNKNRREDEFIQPRIKEADLNMNSEEEMLIFYKSGMVIVNGEQIPRYNMCFRNMETHKLSKFKTFLISNVEEEKLCFNEEYRKKFIEEICLTIMEWDKEGFPESLKWELPYLGAFDEENSSGLKQDQKRQKYFKNLSEEQTDEKIKSVWETFIFR